MIDEAIKVIARGEKLDQKVLEGAFQDMLSGSAAPEQIGAFLASLAVRGETSKELEAGARILRDHARTLNVDGDVLDTCGTGGLTWKSLNTSTASAIVIAAAGGRVAKHGNRSVPPKTGSADVLELLGVNIEIDEATFHKCLNEAGVAFMFARTHHSAMRHVAPIRAKLGIRTVFNLLGPLTNPASAKYQVLGVFAPDWVRPIAETLSKLGSKRAWVVHGLDGIDELSIAGITKVAEVTPEGITEFEITPEDAGLGVSPLSALEGGAPEDNALAVRELFDGQEGPFRDCVALNAAAGLHVIGLADDLRTGAAMAMEVLDNGKARDTLRSLVTLSNGKSLN